MLCQHFTLVIGLDFEVYRDYVNFNLKYIKLKGVGVFIDLLLRRKIL